MTASLLTCTSLCKLILYGDEYARCEYNPTLSDGPTIGSSVTGDNLLGVPETLLPAEPGVIDAANAAAGDTAALRAVVIANPTSSLAWALLSDATFDEESPLESYAYARVGYHRGLDSLRKAGWKGHGPVPWAHEPNRGVLRSLAALLRGATAIGETGEVERLTEFLRDADATTLAQLQAEAAGPVDTLPPTEVFVIRGED
jgi:hypothetical protein